jgi:hypothetical protein
MKLTEVVYWTENYSDIYYAGLLREAMLLVHL